MKSIFTFAQLKHLNERKEQLSDIHKSLSDLILHPSHTCNENEDKAEADALEQAKRSIDSAVFWLDQIFR